MTDNKRPTPDELRNAQDATFTTGEGKAPELGVKNASAEGSTYRPDWVPEDAKKDDTFACHVMKGVKEMHDGLLSSSAHLAPSVRPVQRRKKLTVADYVRGIEQGDRVILSRAITLVESNNKDHFKLAQQVLQAVLPRTGKALRIGITGVPGAGKSTFIEAFGNMLIEAGYKVAVLAVDPTLGGVARKSRETMLLCEAAGYDIILVETVGVGQSEVTVRSMVDFFMLIVLTGAGDELQGIKKGVMELADAIVVNKADGDNLKRALIARSDYDRMLHYIRPATEKWKTQAYTCSAVTKDGLDELWDVIQEFAEQGKENGVFLKRRQEQSLRWVRDMIDEHLHNLFFNNVVIQGRMGEVEAAVLDGEMSESQAVEELIGVFDKSIK